MWPQHDVRCPGAGDDAVVRDDTRVLPPSFGSKSGLTPQYRIALCYCGAVKPAPFAYHRPATIPETVALLAELAPRGRADPRGRSEPGADHGLSPGAPRASDRHQPGCRARQAGSRGWPPPHRRADAPRRVPPAGCGGTARRIAGNRGGRHRTLSDPDARHVLRQPCTCRPGGGMGPCRGDIGCRAGRHQPAR